MSARIGFGSLLALAVICLPAGAGHAQRTTGTQGVIGNPNCPPPVLPGGIVPKNWSCRTGTQNPFESNRARLPPPPDPSCREQVEVTDFRSETHADMAYDFRPVTVPNRTWAVRLWAAGSGRQGIEIVASAVVREGAIPVDDIQLRFVQNVTDYRRVVEIAPPPWEVMPPFPNPRCQLPLLDTFRDDPPPFYRPVDQSGGVRELRVTDSPGQTVWATHADGARTTAVAVAYAFEVYLGCIVGGAPESFETLGMLRWEARLAGDLHQAPAWFDVPVVFVPDDGWLGTLADPAIDWREPPAVMIGPTFNQCVRGGP